MVVEEERARVEALPGTTVTVLEVADDAGRVLSLGDILAAAPGVHVDTAGGVGATQTLRIRGATGAEIRILVDGVPLAQDGTGALDLSALPLDNLERVEVYRGALPAALGGEGVGGAINLVTRAPEGGTRSVVRFAGGSFHTVEGSAWLEAGQGRWRGAAHVAGQAARNDYAYYDDNGTPYTLSDDDPEARRANADFRRLDVAGRARREGLTTRMALSGDVLLRGGGVPGPGAWQASSVRYGDTEARAAARLARVQGAAVEAEGTWSGEWGAHRYEDPEGQVGLGTQDLESRLGATALEGRLTWHALPGWSAAGSARGAWEAWSAADLLDDPVTRASRRRGRLGGVVSVEARTHEAGTGLRGLGAVRWSEDLAWESADGALPWDLDGVVEGRAPTLLGSPSGSLSVGFGSHLGLRASGGASHRLPTFAELYGDEGGVLGNEDLRPERATSLDGGLDLAGSRREVGGNLALTAFWRDVQDLIAWVQNSQYTLRAENFERMRVRGGEVEGGIRGSLGVLGRAELAVAWSIVDTENRSGDPVTDGKALPGQPLNALWLDGELGPPLARVGATLEYDSGDFRDSANLFPVPARTFLHARLTVDPGTVRARRRWPCLGLEVRNVLDHRVEVRNDVVTPEGPPGLQAVADFWGYPLPGRAFYASVTWSPGEAREGSGPLTPPSP